MSPSSRSLLILVAWAAAWGQEPPPASPAAAPPAFVAPVRQDSAASPSPAAAGPARVDTASAPVRATVDSTQAIPADSLSRAAFAASDSASRARIRLVPVVVRSSAPPGSKVTLEGLEARMDSTGRFLASAMVDSTRRATGTVELCLFAGGQNLCTPVRPQGFDTLDIAPLQVKIDSVVETRDTVRTVTDTTRYDSAALRSDAGPKVIQSAAGGTVVVRGKRRPPRVLGQERVTVQTIKRLPGLAEPDVIRAVQALPGVVASSDFSTKVYVRGSSSDQNLILFDNAVVYSPAHFGGLFSTFLADATGGLDFYKGGFEPKWGNRLASVLLVSSKVGGTDRDTGRDSTSWFRQGLDYAVRGTESAVTGAPKDSIEKPRTQGAVRLTTFSGSFETDGVQGDASWTLAGRRTWIGTALAAARKANITDLQLDYDFYDWQGSVAWGHAGDTVRASLYQGRDKLDFNPFSVQWGNLAAPVNIKKRLGTDFTFLGSGSYSSYDQTVQFGDIFRFYNSIGSWNGTAALQWDPVPAHRVLGGTEYNHFDVNFTQDFMVASLADTLKSKSDLEAFFLQDRWILDTTKSITFGARVYWYPELSDVHWDPRATFTWRFAKDWRGDLHLGRYTQYMTSLRFADMELPTEFWYAAQKPMSPTTQDMLSFGLERQNLGAWGLRTTFEGYYKNIRAVPLLYQIQSTASQDSANDASGYDYFARSFQKQDGWSAGFEWGINKEEGWWTASMSYALGWAVLQQRAFSNELQSATFKPYWADWDQRHTFKLTSGINWIGRKSDEALHAGKAGWGDYLRSSLQLNINSGHPYTAYLSYQRTSEPAQPPDGGQGAGGPVPGVDGNTLTVQGDRNSARAPGYFRLDITPIDWGRTGKWRFYYTIINVTDSKNQYAINYDTRKNPPEKNVTYQFPYLPIFLGYEYQF
jgi:hypothetical protein